VEAIASSRSDQIETGLSPVTQDGLWLYLVRHGSTVRNGEKVVRGWENPDLDKEGRGEARTLARGLSSVPLARIYTSDLRRAKTTADFLEKEQPTPVKKVESISLRAFNYGKWTGQPLAKVSKAMKALQEAWVTKPGAKAPGGESFQEYQDRTEEFLEVVSNVKRPKGRVNVAVVAHRNVLMMLAYCLNGGRLAGEEISMLDRIVQEPARLSVVKHTPSKGFQVLKMNVLEP